MPAHLFPEEMNNHIAAIDQDPVADRGPFDPHIADALFFEQDSQMLSQRRQMALGAARCDNHGVGNARFAVKIDDNDIFGLVVIQGLPHQGRQRSFTIEG